MTLVFELDHGYAGLLEVLEVMGRIVVVAFDHSLALTIIKLMVDYTMISTPVLFADKYMTFYPMEVI